MASQNVNAFFGERIIVPSGSVRKASTMRTLSTNASIDGFNEGDGGDLRNAVAESNGSGVVSRFESASKKNASRTVPPTSFSNRDSQECGFSRNIRDSRGD